MNSINTNQFYAQSTGNTDPFCFPPTEDSNNRNITYLLAQASASLSSKCYDAAIQIAEIVLQKVPLNPFALQVQGEALYWQDKYDEIVQLMERVEEKPENVECLMLKAAAQLKLKRPLIAYQVASTVCNLNPNHTGAWQMRVEAACAFGWDSVAFQIATARLAVDPNDPKMKQYQCDTYQKMHRVSLTNKPAEVIKATTSIIENNPKDLFARNTLARALTAYAASQFDPRDTLEQARAHLKEVFQHCPENSGEKIYAIVTSIHIHLLSKQFSDAYEKSMEILNSAPIDALNSLTHILNTLKTSRNNFLIKSIKARALVDKALLDYDPDMANALLSQASEIAQYICKKPHARNIYKDFAENTLEIINLIKTDPKSIQVPFLQNTEILNILTQISDIETQPMKSTMIAWHNTEEADIASLYNRPPT